MNILLLGSGGREHAMAWKIAQSKKLNKLFIAPGNAGTEELGENIDLNLSDFDQIKVSVLALNIDLVVVGPEDPLVNGIRDYFETEERLKHIPVIGPNKVGAQLEGSKEFAKEFMEKYNIPTAKYKSFSLAKLEDGYRFLESLEAPYVLKADGLAAGKGVLIVHDLEEAKSSLKEMLEGKFGEASAKVVIEEFLSGLEVSYFAISDGDNYKLLPEAKDYKKIGENDTGLNTGGMGAVSPVGFADHTFTKKVIDRIVEPTIKGLKEEGIVYQGFLFFGLIEVKGEPMVIEYNVRMGDPETEVVMPRIASDFLDLLAAIPERKLDQVNFEITPQTACTVMLVSGGYPESYDKNQVMSGMEETKNSLLFHAGTKRHDNKILSNGGRVMAITSLGNNMEEALKYSYINAEKINFNKKYYRKDIGFDL